jgi:CubicO group peptidase (beta-lactamase class C family)
VDLHIAGASRRGRPEDAAAADDPWHIGSCGKSMTAALYARLVEAGRAEWSASIVDLFHDLDVHRDAGGTHAPHDRRLVPIPTAVPR